MSLRLMHNAVNRSLKDLLGVPRIISCVALVGMFEQFLQHRSESLLFHDKSKLRHAAKFVIIENDSFFTSYIQVRLHCSI